jgi:ribonuclease HI
VTLFTGSQYLMQGWLTWQFGERRERANSDLWNELDLVTGAHTLSIEWLAGYDPLIARADKLARDAAMPHLPARIVEAILGRGGRTGQDTRADLGCCGGLVVRYERYRHDA